MLHLLVWLPEQDTTQQPQLRHSKTANEHRRQHAYAQQNPTPKTGRQKVNSDEREVVQTTYPQIVAGMLIPTKENMRHYASLRNGHSKRCLPRHTYPLHACAYKSYVRSRRLYQANNTNAPTRHTSRSTAQTLYTRAVRRDTVRFISGQNNTTHKQSPFY